MCPTQVVLARLWRQLRLRFGCELLFQVQIEDSRGFAYGVVVRIRGRGQPVDLIEVLQGLLAVVSLSHFQESSRSFVTMSGARPLRTLTVSFGMGSVMAMTLTFSITSGMVLWTHVRESVGGPPITESPN